MIRHKLLPVVCIIVMITGILAAAGCSGKADAPAEKKVYELTFGVAHPMEVPMMSEINTAWKNWIEKESGGRIKITFYPAEQAAKASDLFDAARDGIVDIGCQMYMTAPGRFPLSEVTMLPFLFDSPGAIAASLTAHDLYKKFPEIQNEYKGVKVLGFHATALNQIHTVKKQVKTLEDLKGLLLNSAGTYGVATIESLGATAEMLAPSEKYDALAKGVVVGNASEWEGQFSWKLFEHTNYSTQADLFTYTFVHVMNLNTWNSLPPDLQALFSEERCIDQSIALAYVFDRDDAKYKQQLDEVYKKRGYPGVYVLPAEERERWKKAAQPVYDRWLIDASAKVGEEKAKEILNAAREIAKQYSSYDINRGAEILRKWGAAGK
ncbi:MAG: TRAP transporter substrate-binding protein [Peptococcaceae bacterium]|nr:TRAP transporter substrate-binding protein [Peptococcaceae bacterium]